MVVTAIEIDKAKTITGLQIETHYGIEETLAGVDGLSEAAVPSLCLQTGPYSGKIVAKLGKSKCWALTPTRKSTSL